ncbi:MAG: response regulator [Bacteroidota bacterium]
MCSLSKEDIDGAQAEVKRAKEVDPKNMYVHAYHERVQLLMADRKGRKDADVAHRKREEEKGNAQIGGGETIEPGISSEAKEEAERAAAERKKRFEEEVKRKLEAEAARSAQKTEERKPAEKPVASSLHPAELAEYSKLLFAAWKNGVPTPDASKQLSERRSSLHITQVEHEELETSVQRESYIRAFKNLWTSTNTAEGASTITALHRRFDITPGKFDGLDLTLLQEIRIPKTRPQLVVIDDDALMLESMAAFLRDQGFDVRPFTTSDEAFRFLMQSTPDLILADINLESSTMGGFVFFQKLQEIPRLACLPFIFVSGLTDEVVVRTGKSLGADDYITKPFVGETLISIIRGKLRRYTELRSIRAN